MNLICIYKKTKMVERTAAIVGNIHKEYKKSE